MKTILLATDFSDPATNAARYALRLAQQINADLLLCNVFHVPVDEQVAAELIWPTADYNSVHTESMQQLCQLARSLADELDPNLYQPQIDCISQPGSLLNALVDITTYKQVDLLVMGLHNSDGLTRFLLGSNSYALLDKLSCPVMLVPIFSQFSSLHQLTLATSLHSRDIDGVEMLIKLITPLSPEINLTHIASPRDAKDDQEALMRMVGQGVVKLNYPLITYTSLHFTGVNSGLCWLAQNGKQDIMVMIHRRHTFLSSLMEGSHTKKVMDKMQAPLLVLPGHTFQ